MDINLIIQQTIFGISVGFIFALISLGFNLTYGLSRVINFAHGAFYMLGAYITFEISSKFNNFLMGILIGVGACIPISFLVEVLVLRRLYGKHIDITLLVTYCVLLMATSGVKIIWGLAPKHVVLPEILIWQLYVGGVKLPVYYFVLGLISFTLFVISWLIFNNTMIGRLIKAAIESKERVESFGINIHKIYTINFIMGSAFAALAGGLMSPLRSVDPTMGSIIVLLCFSVVIIGGLGSIMGTIIGGLLLGLVFSYMAVLYPVMAEGIVYIIMAIFLLVKPKGFFGIE